MSRVLTVYDNNSNDKDKLRFIDFIPLDIIDNVNTLYDYGIITGYSDNTFRYSNNATRAEALVIIVKTMHSSFRDLNNPIPIQVYLNDFNYLIIKMKLPNEKKQILEFNYGGVNSIYGLSKISNEESQLIIGTDFIGPYIMTSQSNSQNNYKFTGGWHGSNGNSTGEATGETNYVGMKAGETDLERNNWISVNELVITVSNDIKGNNTTNYILNEIITYNITNQLVEISVQGIAKEDLFIHRYYGLQTQNNLWNTVTYTDTSIPINEFSNSYVTNHYTLKDFAGYYLKTILDDSGLGDFNYRSIDQPKCFTLAYGKSYFNLINGKTLELFDNDSFYWKGSYFFGFRK